MTTTLRNPEIARTILQQLGGGMFRAMTGSRDFLDMGSGLSLKFGRGTRDGITHMSIVLDADDTYTVRFYRQWGGKQTEKGTTVGAYVDMLRPLIESATGFYLSL